MRTRERGPELRVRSTETQQNTDPNQPPGSIEGQVLFQGEHRKWPPRGGQMTDVVVYLKGNNPGRAPTNKVLPESIEVDAGADDKAGPAVLDQFDMTFVPHIVMMQQGGTLELRNSDSPLHNVNGIATVNQAFNVALPPGATTRVVLPRHEFIRVICNFHSRMTAWVAVMPNRFFTKTNEQSRFTLNNIPPGEYELAGWHENVYPPYSPHRVSMDVIVQSGQTTVLELDFP